MSGTSSKRAYRPGEPLLPWVYAIARCVRVDGHRSCRRINQRETTVETMPELPIHARSGYSLPTFDLLVSALPKSQREVVTLLKVGGLSLEEVALATSSTVGAVKQKAHRAYCRLRGILSAEAADAT